MGCIRLCGGVPFPKLVADCYNELVDVVEDFFKSNLRQHGVPVKITNKIEWNNINPDEDVGVPKRHDQEFQAKKAVKQGSGTPGNGPSGQLPPSQQAMRD